MAAPRKNPDVAFKLWQELNIDARLFSGDIITKSRHCIHGPQLRAHIAQRIARAGGYDAEVRTGISRLCAHAPARVMPAHLLNMRLFDLGSGALRALEQHP